MDIYPMVLLLQFAKIFPRHFKFQQAERNQKYPIGQRFSDILVGSVTIVASACIGEEIEWQPTQQNFKKLSLINPTSDTIYVNMLTDIYWDKDDYCDFMDIRIPPKQSCRILVPVNAVYNVYFSGTPQNDDDEMIEIKTSEKSRINLLPGMTLISDIK
jgi:hypothetical protein